MRFSSRGQLPDSQWICHPKDVERVAQALVDYQGMYGFDTETDGLGYTIEKVKRKSTGQKSVSEDHAGDGLGAYLEVVCLAFDNQRYGIDVGHEFRDNLNILAPAIWETQEYSCCFNAIFDWNVWEYNLQGKYSLTTCYADGLTLWQLWDEDAEDTHGKRGLKARSKHYLGINMSSFGDLILKQGGIRQCLRDRKLAKRTRNYCSRDAWAHLGICALGERLARNLTWCMLCPKCDNPAYQRNHITKQWVCADCGDVNGGKMLSMWDWHKQKDIPFLQILKEMEQDGVPVSEQYMRQFIEPLEQSLQTSLKQFQREASDALVKLGGDPVEITPSSQQLSKFYFQDFDVTGKRVGLGLPVIERTDAGGASTTEKVMDELTVRFQAPGTTSLMRYRKIEKILSTYAEGATACIWDDTNRVHPKIRPDTATGRCSCRRPNMMNLPRDPLQFEVSAVQPLPAETVEQLATLWGIAESEAQAEFDKPCYHPSKYAIEVRRAVVAPPGYSLVGADYAQLEVRLTAAESQDSKLIDIINTGKDMHSYTASIVYAAQVPGLSYNDIVEAKKWKDVEGPETYASKPALYRFATLGKMLRSKRDFDEVLTMRCQHMSGGERSQVRSSVETAVSNITSALSARDMLGAAQHKMIDAVALGASDSCVAEGISTIEALMSVCTAEDIDACLSVLGAKDKELRDFRQAAKNAIFGIIYGIAGVGLAVQITKATGVVCAPEDAQKIIESIKTEAYPGIGIMIERLHETAKKYGYVRTQMGRYRHPAGVHSGNHRHVGRALRQAGNAPIQGLAANIMQTIMIALRRDPKWNGMKARMIMQVHDELLSLVPEEHADDALALQIHHMETSHRLVTPCHLAAEGGVAKVWCDIK